MKFKFLLITLFTVTNCFSQDKNELHTADVTKITLVNPGFSHEKSIGKFKTLYIQAFMNTSAIFSDSGPFDRDSKFFFDPAATLQYRRYYGGTKRLLTGKRTEMNSMNYLTAIFESVFSKRPIRNTDYTEKNIRPINTLGLAWGLQRNFKNRFSLDFNLGLGYLFSTETVSSGYGIPIKANVRQPALIGQINVGLWLNRKE